MNDHENDIRDRLNLIENMIAEGRRKTESWGWTFVVWGLAYYVAIAWSTWGHNGWAWPITVVAAAVVTVVVASLRKGNHPETTLSRAVGAVWITAGISMFLLFLALGMTGRLTDIQLFVAVLSAMLGMANGASAMMLRWRVQSACALVWWGASMAACFLTVAQSTIVFLVAVFFCQIVFGVYGMIADAQWRRRRGEVHARTA